MSNSNSFQGPDIASLLSMINGGGGQNGGGQQRQSGTAQNSVGSHGQNGNGESAIMSSLLQGLAGALNQQQQQTRNGANDVLSLLAAQQLSQLGSGGLDFARLAGSGILGNSQGNSMSAPSDQQTNLAKLFGIQQGNQSNQNQEQALALARLAGARLLSGDDSGRKEVTQDNLSSSQAKGDNDNASPFLVHRKNALTGSNASEESNRGRNLEPGAIAVPCRARGMPMDHNPLTAYFVINNGIHHGEDVVCSHPACRNAGVKFRYCSFCKAPVAKRNFRRRHNHGGDTSVSGSDGLDDESARVSTVSATSSRRLISASEEEPEAKRAKLISSEDDDVDTATDSSKSSSDHGEKKEKVSPKPAPPVAAEPAPKGDANTITGEADSSTATIKASGKSISQERRQEWAKLLEERPITNDAESMSKWIDKILKVSDGNRQAINIGEAARHMNGQV